MIFSPVYLRRYVRLCCRHAVYARATEPNCRSHKFESVACLSLLRQRSPLPCAGTGAVFFCGDGLAANVVPPNGHLRGNVRCRYCGAPLCLSDLHELWLCPILQCPHYRSGGKTRNSRAGGASWLIQTQRLQIHQSVLSLLPDQLKHRPLSLTRQPERRLKHLAAASLIPCMGSVAP